MRLLWSGRLGRSALHIHHRCQRTMDFYTESERYNRTWDRLDSHLRELREDGEEWTEDELVGWLDDLWILIVSPTFPDQHIIGQTFHQ